MDKIRFFFIALLGMGAAHLSAQTADSTQTSPWTTEGFAGLKLTQVSLTTGLPEVTILSLLTCKVLIRLTIKRESIYGTTVLNWLMA